MNTNCTRSLASKALLYRHTPVRQSRRDGGLRICGDGRGSIPSKQNARWSGARLHFRTLNRDSFFFQGTASLRTTSLNAGARL
ncbi:Hypothetical protein SMAX5B_007002 [Scophthalmus maximus]|uniref:Uncharacterized protein n=1 Tax=Scophthalmus maximus TaxID=52904 RepID=A0A2U9BA98_SCOMX|nr:Hypothetical protein SMAX5B_007002 [Scophthalmus maximus]